MSAERLYAAVQEGIARAAIEGPPEAVLRGAVEPALEEALRERGARARRRAEVHLAVPAEESAALLDAPLGSRGRLDAIFNRFVIEFEPPGSLRPSVMHSHTQHAVSQVQQYLRGVSEEDNLPIERLAGCAFDGTWIVYVTAEQGAWNVQPPIRADPASLQALVDTLESLAAGRGLTAENLADDFGRTSDVAAETVKALSEVLLAGGSQRTQALFEQWRIDIGSASGFGSTHDLPEWRDLCADLGVSAEETDATHVLFALQTYFALVSRLFALVVLEGATGETLMSELREAPDLWSGLEQLEAGELTARTRAQNVIEPGIFSWYVSERESALFDALDHLVRAVEEYSAEVVEITPIAARDVFKALYQRLVPRTIRHRLGEFYTPAWLAAYVVSLVDAEEEPLTLDSRVLDPACGSGTFLVEVLSRLLPRAAAEEPEQALRKITRNVVGFDLSPLAVQAARVNYLLAIAPLARRATEPIVLPVFLADSVSPPRHGSVLEGDVLRFRSAEGEWHVPRPITDEHRLSDVGKALIEAARRGDIADAAVAALRVQMPDLPWGVEQFDEHFAALYAKLADLHQNDRDGMWWNLISNSLAPTFEEPFDVVIGNPPWVSWETLPESYRRLNEDLWQLYNLHPDPPPGQRQRTERVKLDLAMLFVARSVHRYLKDGGSLVFLITASVFQSELAGRGFRRRFVPPDANYSFVSIEDLTRLRVFEDAANRTSILHARRAQSQETQIPAKIWRGAASSTIPASAQLDAALSLVARHDVVAEPVDPRDRRSPLLLLPADALAASRDLRRPSPYLERIREGINTRGANGILFVDILRRSDGSLLVQNDPARGRIRGLPQLAGEVEEEAVRMLVRGEDVSTDHVSPEVGVLFFHDDQHVSAPLIETEASRRFPQAVAFARSFQTYLQGRSRFRNFDPTGAEWLGIYSVTTAALAEHKVLVREIATDLVTAAVSGKHLIPDHKLYVIPCQTANEASRLAGVLNSDVVRGLVRAFSVSTSLTGSFLRYVGVRDLADYPDNDGSDEWLAGALGLTTDQLRVLRQALATSPI